MLRKLTDFFFADFFDLGTVYYMHARGGGGVKKETYFNVDVCVFFVSSELKTAILVWWGLNVQKLLLDFKRKLVLNLLCPLIFYFGHATKRLLEVLFGRQGMYSLHW